MPHMIIFLSISIPDQSSLFPKLIYFTQNSDQSLKDVFPILNTALFTISEGRFQQNTFLCMTDVSIGAMTSLTRGRRNF